MQTLDVTILVDSRHRRMTRRVAVTFVNGLEVAVRVRWWPPASLNQAWRKVDLRGNIGGQACIDARALWRNFCGFYGGREWENPIAYARGADVYGARATYPLFTTHGPVCIL